MDGPHRSAPDASIREETSTNVDRQVSHHAIPIATACRPVTRSMARWSA
jgi:hypothetical protein